MSLLSRIWTGGQDARAANFSTANWFGPEIPTPAQDALMYGGAIPEGNPMGLASFYACVRILADIVSTLSIRAYRHKDGAKILVDPQPQLLVDSPYPELTWFSWLWMLMRSLAITGNGFGYVTARGADDRPIGIMPIHPDCVRIELPTEQSPTKWPDPIYFIDGKRVASDDVIHIKRFPEAGRAWGMSPVQMMASPIALGLAAEKYGLRYFRDSANPSGLLTTDAELTPEQQKRAMKSWIVSHQGRRLPAVMSGGLKWQSVTLTPEESQFLDTRKFQRSDIAMFMGVPPHMIGDTEKSTSWGTGIEEQTLGFMKFNFAAWLVCIEQTFTSLLPRGVEAKFDTKELLRTDFKTFWESMNIARNAGAYSVNDILALNDQPPIGPEGDIRLQPMNYIPLGTPVSEYPGKGSDTPANQSSPPAADGENKGAQ